MSARIMPFRLEAFDMLPKHARRCVFWEVDPATLPEAGHLADPEFEKEAWLSMVMLEWGSCGQIALPVGPDDVVPAVGEVPCLGYAFYAPPRAVPRVHLFPTAPVSADAVLLTTVGVDTGVGSPGDSGSVQRDLITGVVGDLVRRGVRALEAFGRTAAAAELDDPDAVSPELKAALTVLGDCALQQCVIDEDFLTDTGFEVVATHRYLPRYRLELESGLGWKADVEAALERLLHGAELRPVGAVAVGAGAGLQGAAEVSAERSARRPSRGPAVRQR